MKIYLVALLAIVMSSGCASSPSTYKEAEAIAELQAEKLKGKVDINSAFGESFIKVSDEVSSECEKAGDIDSSGSMVIKIDPLGKIQQVFYDSSNESFLCIAKNVIGRACYPPPIAPLYVKYSHIVIVD